MMIRTAKTNPLLLSLMLAAAALIPLERVGAIVHLWEISQVCSNEDGSVQYIELYVDSFGEYATRNHQVITHQDGGQNEQRFTFPENLPFDTTDSHLLFATGPIAGVEPDFVIPEQFVPFDFATSGTVDISSLAWAGNPNRVDYDFIPADGFRSIDGHGTVQDPATEKPPPRRLSR